MSRAPLRGMKWCLIVAVLALSATTGLSCGAPEPTPTLAPTPLPTPILTVTLTPWSMPTSTPAADYNKAERELIGEWFDDDPGVDEYITIYRERGRLRMEYKSRNGTTLFDFLIVESQSPRGRRFQASESLMFYIIDARGDLQIWDHAGLLTTARKTK